MYTHMFISVRVNCCLVLQENCIHFRRMGEMPVLSLLTVPEHISCCQICQAAQENKWWGEGLDTCTTEAVSTINSNSTTFSLRGGGMAWLVMPKEHAPFSFFSVLSRSARLKQGNFYSCLIAELRQHTQGFIIHSAALTIMQKCG